MVLLGDTAQLPPVNLDISPALDTQTLSLNYNKEVGILSSMKSCVRKKIPNFAQCDRTAGIIERLSLIFSLTLKFKDIIRLTDGYDIQDAINSAYSNYSIEDTACSL
jgi:hypothetical protein